MSLISPRYLVMCRTPILLPVTCVHSIIRLQSSPMLHRVSRMNSVHNSISCPSTLYAGCRAAASALEYREGQGLGSFRSEWASKCQFLCRCHCRMPTSPAAIQMPFNGLNVNGFLQPMNGRGHPPHPARHSFVTSPLSHEPSCEPSCERERLAL